MSRAALLAICAAWLGRPGAEERARLALKQAAIDPELFADQARGQRVAPVALAVAERLGAAEPVIAALRGRVRSGAALALALESAAAELAAAASERGLSAVYLKGPALDLRYGARGLRAFDDLDLLVPETELPRWHECLRALGYEPVPPFGYGWKRGKFEAIDLHSRSLDLCGVIDVPEPTRPVRLDPAAMLARAGRPEGLAFPALAVEDELVFAACHGLGGHLFERLSWLLDVAVLAGQVREPARLLEIAAESGAGRMLFHAVEIARRLGLAAEPPEEWLEPIRPARVGWLERRLVERLIRRGLPERTEFLLAMAMPAPAGFKRAMLARALFPSRKRLHVAAFSGRGRIRGVLTHFRQLARIGALVLWG